MQNKCYWPYVSNLEPILSKVQGLRKYTRVSTFKRDAEYMTTNGFDY